MSRVTRKLQQRYEVLTGEARELAGRGLHEEADARLGEALDVARQLAEAGEDARRKQAEIDVLRGKLEFTQGYGASAVCHLENALGKYMGLLADPRLGSDYGVIRDLTQVLIDNAEIMLAYGDPALAAASADSAWRLYVGRYDAPGWDPGLMGRIAKAASAILARAGRLEDAIAADDCVVIEARDAANASGSAADRSRLAAALAVQGLHHNASGQQDSLQKATQCLSQARQLDAAAAAEAIAEWDRVRSQQPPVTLAAALGAAARLLGSERVPADLPEAFTKGMDKAVFRMSRRCEAHDAPRYAIELAGLAVDLLPVAVKEGLRIGLEAHYLFASGWSGQPIGRDQALAWGVPWTRLILEVCRVLATDAQQPTGVPLALDLVTWNLERIDMLHLTLIGGNSDQGQGPSRDEIARLLLDCLDQHAGLFDANGEPDKARHLRQKAVTIAQG